MSPLANHAFAKMNGIGNAIVVGILLTVLVIAFGAIAYSVTIPGNVFALILTLATGAACFCALGLAVTTIIPNPDAAPAIVNLVFFPILFISGTFFEVPKGSTLAAIASVFPVRHFITATLAVFEPHAHHSLRGGDLLIMVIVGGYETFVSRMDLRGHPDQPEWLSHVNASVLKVKLAMSIIGISSIHLLKSFIRAGDMKPQVLMWQTLIHITFLA